MIQSAKVHSAPAAALHLQNQTKEASFQSAYSKKQKKNSTEHDEMSA